VKTLREIIRYLAYLAAVTLFAVFFAGAWHDLLLGLDFHHSRQQSMEKRPHHDPAHYVILDCP